MTEPCHSEWLLFSETTCHRAQDPRKANSLDSEATGKSSFQHAALSVKDQIIDTFGFVGYVASVTSSYPLPL
jgi:hypothetical protein